MGSTFPFLTIQFPSLLVVNIGGEFVTIWLNLSKLTVAVEKLTAGVLVLTMCWHRSLGLTPAVLAGDHTNLAEQILKLQNQNSNIFTSLISYWNHKTNIFTFVMGLKVFVIISTQPFPICIFLIWDWKIFDLCILNYMTLLEKPIFNDFLLRGKLILLQLLGSATPAIRVSS